MHPKFCCGRAAQIGRASIVRCELLTQADSEHRWWVFYAFGGGVSGAVMRLKGVWTSLRVTRVGAESSAPGEAERPAAKVSPHEVMAWQQTTVAESQDLP